VNDFYRTRMGHTFFEVTLPRLVVELARLNDLLERGFVVAERAFPPATPPAAPPREEDR
jgi:hypothetical protein